MSLLTDTGDQYLDDPAGDRDDPWADYQPATVVLTTIVNGSSLCSRCDGHGVIWERTNAAAYPTVKYFCPDCHPAVAS